MANTEHLSVAEFTRWTLDDRIFKDRMIAKLDTLQSDVLENAVEIRFMKQRQSSGKFSTGLKTIISGVVGGIVGSFK